MLHELGHELGFDDVSDPAYEGLMSAWLSLGTRRLPDIDPSAADRLLADLAHALAADGMADDGD